MDVPVGSVANGPQRSSVSKGPHALFPVVSFNVETGETCRSGTFARGGHAEETNCLPVSTVFDLLADERRRHLLYFLIEEAGGEARPVEVADHLCSAPAATGSSDPDAVLVELHHRHLPRMESAGLIEYEGRDGPVRYLGDPLVEACLARVATRDFDR